MVWDEVCRECGEELPPAFYGRPRAYCGVTCRQRAYRRRKAAARATKTTKTTEADPAPDRARPGPGRSASAEAIMIRVRVDGRESADAEPADTREDLLALNELAEAALLLARRLRAPDRARAPTAAPAQTAATDGAEEEGED